MWTVLFLTSIALLLTGNANNESIGVLMLFVGVFLLVDDCKEQYDNPP